MNKYTEHFLSGLEYFFYGVEYNRVELSLELNK